MKGLQKNKRSEQRLTKEKVWDNYELYWYSIPSFTYVEKSGAKVVEGSKKINTDDLIAVSYTHLDVYKRQ